MDNLVFEESVNTEISSSEFVDKQWLYVNDNNNSNYTGQIVLDTTALSNCGSYINWSEAFLAIPLVLQWESSTLLDSAVDSYNPFDYVMGLKSGFWQIIHSLSVEFNNGSIIQQTPFLNLFCSFKNLTSWSNDDIKNWGAVTGFYPDTADCWLYNNIATANSLVNFMNTSGQGFCNNRNAPYVTPNAFGVWSGTLTITIADSTTAITASTNLVGLPQVGMRVFGAGLPAGAYISSITTFTGTSITTGAISVAATANLTNAIPVTGISPILGANVSTQATTYSDQLRSTYNAGLLQRQQWINYSPAAATNGLTTSNTNNQIALLAKDTAGYNQLFTNYIQRANAAGYSQRAIVVDAVVRLKDVADFFQKCPLLKGSTMRFYINTNQVYFTCGLVAPQISGAVSVTAGSAGSTTSQSATGCLALTSSPIILGGGGTNPLMVASMDLGQGSYNLVPAQAQLPAAPISIKFGLSIVKTQFLSGQFTNTITAPITSVRLYAPAYTMSPLSEQRYLSLTPTKKIVYNDVFYYSYQNISASSTFSVLVSNGLPNIRSILIVPVLPKASNGTASTYPSTTALAGVTTDSLLSPFSTTGGTPDPIAIGNLQIQISGKNLFINNLQYDYENFIEQLSCSNQLNGNLTTSLSSGLIGKEEFQQLYRYYYGNAGRSIPSEDGIAKAVQVSGTNLSSVPISILVYIEFERSITIDVRSGSRIA
jgi:hypothetical protein